MRTTGWVAVLVITLALAPASRASGVSVTDLTNSVTATQLAQSLAGGGVAISNVTYTGDNRAAGSFTAGTASIGFDTGLVLSSGYVQTHVGDTPCSQGVEGPNNCYEAQGGNSGGADGGENGTGLGTAGDTDLDTLAGGTTADAAILSFDFVPQQATVKFSYVFSSEEYSDYANTNFNDVFGFFVNGTNCALVPNTSDPVAVNTINNGNDAGGDTTAHNANLFRDNVRPSPSIDSQMDGLTTVLTCTANVNAGQTNHLKLAIADTSDSDFDSAVFIKAGSLVSGNTLTVNKGGNGAGSVSSSPSGINCGATCSAQYASGTMVTLTATAATGSTFTGWSGGGCSGTGTCVVTMNADTTVTATFTLVKHTLTVSRNGTGTGTVSSSPSGINCGATCTHDYDHGTVVTLTPTPDSGSVFTGWSGDCSGTGACMVTMDQARSVTATFAAAHTLTVSRAGNGAGSVSSSPSGINCGATCSAQYANGTMVTLTATAATGSTFTGWSGGGCSGTGTCEVTLNADTSVTATFTLNKYTLTVSKAGAGSGSVSSSPAGINCGATCSAQYDYGTVVTLTATAAAGSTFSGWSGGGCSGTGTCVVTIDQARSVTATFDVPPPPQTLTVTKAGTGSGTVTSSPTGINCGATCSAQYANGTSVTLTAVAATGSTFTGWSGACSGTATCTVTMDQARSVTATFDAVPVESGPPSVPPGGLFCGVQHRGKCNGIKIKTEFSGPGNAVWQFAAYNPSPGHSRAKGAASKVVVLGTVKKTITKAGTVTIVFKLKPGAKTKKLYKKVVKLKLKAIRVTLTFTTASGQTVKTTTSVKLKR
jgi:hypothetical protein